MTSVNPLGRPIRVLRVITRLNIGGPAIQALSLTQALNDEEFVSHLVAGDLASGEGDMFQEYQGRIQPEFVPGLGRELSPLKDLATLYRLWQIMRRWRPDVVHTHTSKAGTLGRIAARLAKVPVVIHTFHGHVFEGYFSPLKSRLFIWIERLMASWSNRLVAISPSQRDDLVMRYRIAPAERVVCIPLGFDLSRLAEVNGRRGELRKQLGLAANEKLVGIVGRLTPIKNHHLFLDAFRQVCERVPNAQAVVVGDGELRGQLEAYARGLDIQGSVHFLGWRRDLVNIYADLDVVCLTSNNEGTPVTIIEAMATARPVVATRVGGIPDLIRDGEHGLLVEPGAPDRVADAVVRLLQMPGWAAQLGKNARERALAFYGFARLKEDITQLYRESIREQMEAAPG